MPDFLTRRGFARSAAAGATFLVAAPRLARARATAEGASAFIEKLGDEVVAIARQDFPSTEARMDEVIERLQPAVDLELIGQLVLGRYWRRLDEAQRQEFVRVYRDYGVAYIARQLADYEGESFDVSDARVATETDAIVATTIARPGGGQPIQASWRVREEDGRYVVIDLIAEGISLVVTQRNELGSVISSQGYDALIQRLTATTRQIRAS